MKAPRVLFAALIGVTVLTCASVTAEASALPGGAATAHRCATTRPFLSQGDRGTCVTFLQQKLTSSGIPTATDGVFGSGTTRSVKTFQRACGFRGKQVDGMVGPGTWAGLLDHSCV
ncbi:peptidoglycan-binding domain-containing protein [Streptomyces griseocarneus]|uniref:peptidoglycan-binding domain-containing protein n=1 Tax=Streptomyces griseocarneus TaxID=51201 RepID=UPI0019961529|nr:peptidoglycan-binding domain-containing protein [Streptomyces griseocarneus]MBZ6475106.1 peptidoglycan-binding protein [Streptomyces griseocarneus]GHG62219.1 hypothetical protein GCM10018779_30740 [Streptomyces griseocarneus]